MSEKGLWIKRLLKSSLLVICSCLLLCYFSCSDPPKGHLCVFSLERLFLRLKGREDHLIVKSGKGSRSN